MTRARDLASTALNSTVNTTELGYLDGVTSSVQTQLDNKLATATAATTYVANSLADAKGDLLTATADNTPARLAVGNNGETLVADSAASTGLRYQGTQTAGKNILINGNFDIWQRGTSFTGSGYFADRWTNIGDFSGVTASQQTTGAANGSRYFLRLTSTAGSSYWSSYQFIETAQVETLQGNTATVSVKLRRNATFNTNAQIFVQKSATVDAGSGASWSTIGSTFSAANASIPTGTTSADWYTLSGSVSVPNDGTANSLRVVINYAALVPTGSILEISQTQLELGSVATTFTRAGGTIQGELAACQRYYWRTTAAGTIAVGSGTTEDANRGIIFINNPVPMRVAPTSVDAATLTVTDMTSYTLDVTSVTGIVFGTNGGRVTFNTSGGQTTNRASLGQTKSTGGHIGFSAEL